jgi:Putative transposase/Transposase zinc-binding domain
MATSGLEVAHIVRLFGAAYREQHRLPERHRRALWDIENCRTAALGGHLSECDHCRAQEVRYNSCRNRHCPKCQSLDTERWLEKRSQELLPVPYFHIVFTLPDELNALVLRNQQVLYDLLFETASQTLLQIAADPKHLGAQIGMFAFLHTWNQQMLDHPHLHFIVPGGGLSPDRRRWVASRSSFFLPVRVLSRLFRGKFLHRLQDLYAAGALVFPGQIAELAQRENFDALIARLFTKEWVVYSKPPFGGPEQVLDYLARYIHRVAISNNRLVRLDDKQVTFSYRDRANGDRRRELTISGEEFVRRLLLHILPDRFVRIRSYGLLAPRNRAKNLALCRELLGSSPAPAPPETPRESWNELLQRLTGVDPLLCPQCQTGRLRPIREIAPQRGIAPRGPP